MTKLGALVAAAILDVSVIAANAFNLNAVLNIAMLVIVAVVALPIIRIRRKDAAIKDLEAECKASKQRRDGALEDLRGAQERANRTDQELRDLRVECAELKARYDEQSKYTAQGAVAHLEEELREHREQVAERHKLMIDALDKLTARLDAAK